MRNKQAVRYMDGVSFHITERQREEEELRLAQFSVEHASDAMFWMDPQGRILYVNEAACGSLGRSREELLSLSIPDIDPLFPKEAWEAHWEKVKVRGSMTFETQHQTKQGRVFPVEITTNYLEFDGKEYAFAFARDITERKQAEEALALALVKSQRQEKEVVALLEGARPVLDGATFEETARAIFNTCKDLFGATAGYVALLSRDGTETEVVFLEPGRMSCTVDPSLPMPIRGLRAEAYRTGEAVFDNDFANSRWMKLMPPGHAPLQNVMITPLLVGGKVAGLMGLANKPGGFTRADATMSMAFGKLIAIALDKSRNLEALRASEEKYRHLIENAHSIIYTISLEGVVTFVSSGWTALLGHPANQVMGKSFREFVHAEDVANCEVFLRKVIETGQRQSGIECRVRHVDGSWRWHTSSAVPLRDEAGTVVGYEGNATDITERKRAERYQNLSAQILGILNEPLGVADVVKQILAAIKRETGLDAVGIRLRSGDDFPYFVQNGFSDEFLLTENTLIARDKNGAPCRDENGKISLECTCGLVISGQTDPANPLFTEGGSCWTNNSLPLLDLPAHQDPRLHPRNQCVHQGYCSVALIPIRAHGDIVGLLQLNDRKKNCFSLEMIHFLEGISASIGVALMRKQQEEALRASEELLRTMTDQVPGVVYQFYARPNGERGLYYVSSRVERLFGLSPELSGFVTRFLAAVVPEDRDAFMQSMDKAVADFSDWNYEGLLQKPGGEKVWISVHSTPARRENEIVFNGLIQDITERKRAEEELYQSRQMLETVLDTVPQRTFWKDRNLAYLGCNRAFATDAGLKDPAEIIGKNDYELAWKETAESYRADDKLVMDLDTPRLGFEEPQSRPDGSQIWLRTSKLPLRNRDGKVIGVIGTYEDISERRRAEAALRESEERHRTILQTTMDGFWLIDVLTGRFSDVNETYCLMSGYTRDELLKLHISDLDAIKTSEEQAAIVQNIITNGSEILETRHRRKDGSVFDVELSVTYQNTKRGQLICFCRDITARKYAEAALRESESRLRTITDSALDAILMMDPQGRISYWNPAAERILGYTSAEAIGQDLHSLIVPPRYHEAHQAAFPAFRQTGQGSALGKTLDREARRKDGKEIPVQLSLSAIQINGGWHAVGIFGDITERKQAEEVLRRYAADLESAKAVQEENATRLRQLAEDLGEAKRQAEAATQAKSEFLANMSHEIRTPMNGVIGMTGLLLDTELTPEQQHYAEIVRTSGEALLTVINDILDFSKIEARKLVLEITDFDLHSVLEYAAAVLAIKASEKGLELTCEREPGTPWLLRGDPGRVRQVLVNLLGNAVKFTHQGEVAIRVRLEAEDERQATLRFTVCDTGIGFQQGRATALFEPFVQGDGSTTRRYGGTGLGLTISKQLVEMMGGQIGVESEEGKGSTFWFTAVFEKQPRPSVVVTGAPPGLQDTKVLVVDDNATNRSLVCRFLTSWGCRPQESADGNSALAILHDAAQGADPFQIALLDRSLPGMDGEELGVRIAADPQLKQTALVLMTGFGRRRQSDWARLQALGFTGHVSKPIWEHSLREALRPLGAKPSGAAPTSAAAGRQPRVVQRKNQARILVAEDNLTNQEVAVAMLNKLGYRADVVAHGVDVLQALRETDYAAVLMDCEMPEMDGYEATRQIRERRAGTRNPNIPIIALTADAMSGDRDKCLQAGMSDYLTKPVEPRQLADVLEKWLLPPTAPGEVRPPADPSSAKTKAVFDPAGLLARLMGDQGLANRVMAGFLNDVPRQLRTLKNRLDAGDAQGARLQAHALKGAAATVSAEALLGLCCEVEAAAAEELSRALPLLPRLEEQFELLKATLKQSGWV
jgi:PAS domain S-box-containing protein